MITSSTLSNGVRVVTHRVEHMHTVSLGIWVANGTRHEDVEHNGVAHFIEHMLFKGTERRTARQISHEMDSMGGILNAFTSHEYVCYYAKVLAKFLPRATDLLSDIFLHSTFPDDELERERKVILQEIKMRDDSPDEYIHDRYHLNCWQGHPLGLPILGTEETIAAMTRDVAVSHKQSRYRPEDIIISAAGNVCHDELIDLVQAIFSRIPSSAWAPTAVAPLEMSGRKVNLTVREMEQTLLCLGTPGLRHDHPDRYAMYLVATILGGGMSSRLFQEVREKKGLAYSVYAYALSHTDSGSLVFYAGTEQVHCREVIDIILREIGRLKDEIVAAEELDASREQVKGRTLMSLESSDSLMTRLAKNEIYLGRQLTTDEVLAGYDAVTSGDIQRVSRTLFRDNAISLEAVGPVGGLGLTSEILSI